MDTPPQPAPEPDKKSLFTTVVTSTPVLLAVIATLILGQSSSEMTKAQYQRAVAGQNQSKVTNQWDFFQAKRIRGTNLETAAAVLRAQNAKPFFPDDLFDAAQNLVRETESAGKEMAKPKEPLEAFKQKADAALAEVTTVLYQAKGDAAKRPEKLKPDMQAALAALDAYPESSPDKNGGDSEIDKEQRDLLAEVLAEIRKFKHEEVAPKTLALKPETVDKAMKKAKARAAEVTRRGKTIDVMLEKIDALVDKQVALAREYERIPAAPILALGPPKEVDEAAKPDARTLRVREGAAGLLASYKAARFAFDARRYEDDARSNQDAAYLYDIQVLQSSARSDRHLSRSFGFMIAMLVAQVGVTIGTLALAMKWRVPTWLIAVIAGLSAIALGAYVYMELGPLTF